MHPLNNGLALLALLAGTTQVAAQSFVLKPGRIEATHRQLPATRASGSFSLHASPAGSSHRTGGGCLVFQPVAGVHACMGDGDCRAKAAALFGNALSTGGYCAAAGGQAKQCWYRPPDTAPVVDARGFMVSRYCVKSGAAALPRGSAIRLAPVDAFPLGAHPVRWRVTTCQNLVAAVAGARPGCARTEAVEGQDKATGFGPTRRFDH